MPIFVYRCGNGHQFERLVPRDADAPACTQCGDDTRKIPAGPSLRRGAAQDFGTTRRPPAGTPIPWRGVASGGPEKLSREVAFRERLAAKAVSGLRVPGSPDAHPDGPGSSGSPQPAS
jgi:hypothetical protein